MPHVAIALVATLAFVLPGEALASSTERGRWRRPLPVTVVAGSFSFDPATPYARGRRRGIDLKGLRGEPVTAACTGRVAHAGGVPAWGSGVTLRCGGLMATELGLGSVAVRRGGAVHAGALVGRLGRRGVLRLGARRAGVQQGYVDPAPLLDGDRPWAAPPAGWNRRRGGRRVVPVLRGAAPQAAAVEPAAPTMPLAAWCALALVAGGAGGTGAALRRHRERRGIETAAAHR